MKTRLLVILLLLAAGCEYQPSGLNERDLRIGPPDIGITVLNEDAVTLLRGPVNIGYRALLSGHTLKSVSVYLDERLAGSSSLDSGSIRLSTEYYPDGDYTLRVVLVTSTNSGSLAERLGAEVYVAEHDYAVTIFNAPLRTPQLVDAGNDAGALRIRWEPFTQPGFQKYKLLRNGIVVAELFTATRTEFHDSAYIGEGGSVALRTTAFGIEMQSNDLFIPSEPVVIESATATPANEMKLVWHPAQFSAGFGAYLLSRSTTSPPAVLARLTQISDTTFVDAGVPFGGIVPYELALESKAGIVMPNRAVIYAPPIGTACDAAPGEHFEYIPGRDVFYQYSYGYASILDPLTLTVTQTSRVDPFPYGRARESDMSPNGLYAYALTALSQTQVKQLDPRTLAVVETIDLDTLLPYPSSTIVDLSVSDGNLLAVLCTKYLSPPVIAVMDMSARTLRASLAFWPVDNWPFQISADGTYIVAVDSLYRLEGNVISRAGRVGRPWAFWSDEAYLVTMTSSQLRLVRRSDLQVMQAIALAPPISGDPSGTTVLTVDHATGAVGLGSLYSNEFQVYDFATGGRRASRGVLTPWMTYQNGFLIGSRLFLPLPLE